MIAQYTAAGIVSELKRLASPASVDSIPSSAMQEDHVSMGWSAARKLRRSVDGLTRVLAVEVLTSARALDLRAPLTAAPATAAVRDAVRAAGVAGPGPDRHLAPEIEAVVQAVLSGALLDAAQQVLPAPLPDDPARREETTWTEHDRCAPTRGTTLTARCWQTEAPLRMLQNNLDPEVAERPTTWSSTAAPAARPVTGPASTRWSAPSRRCATTRRCSCSPAGPSGCCRRTSGRRGCSSPTPTSSRLGDLAGVSGGSSASV
jgi:hypothetical protein